MRFQSFNHLRYGGKTYGQENDRARTGAWRWLLGDFGRAAAFAAASAALVVVALEAMHTTAAAEGNNAKGRYDQEYSHAQADSESLSPEMDGGLISRQLHDKISPLFFQTKHTKAGPIR